VRELILIADAELQRVAGLSAELLRKTTPARSMSSDL